MAKWRFETVVVGMQYHHNQLKFSVDENFKWESEDGQYVGYRLENKITLRRDYDNEYDKYAVQVLMDGDLVGYIPKEDAKIISKKMDQGIIVEMDESPFLLTEGSNVKRLTLRLYADDKGGKTAKGKGAKKVMYFVSQRIPCSDGNCIGTINENGVCNICGKPFKQEEKSKEEERTKELSERIPCRDGGCVGIINEKGVCNICGKPYTK
jgi:hypothetical protein